MDISKKKYSPYHSMAMLFGNMIIGTLTVHRYNNLDFIWFFDISQIFYLYLFFSSLQRKKDTNFSITLLLALHFL